MSLIPSQDQVMGQLRIIIPALGTIATAFGISSAQAGSYTQIALASVGPISYIVVAIWSLIANSRASIMKSAAKPVDANTPAPKIILPPQEAALADKLPSNVTTSNVTSNSILKVLLVAFALSAFLAAAPVQAQGLKLVKPTGNIVNDIAAATAGGTTPGGFRATGAPVTDIQTFLNAKFLPDLQYALKLATASKNTVTADCYQAWIDIITTQQTAVKNADGTDIAMPDPHVITEFEKIVELRNALQPESPFMIKCSPVASMVKLDIAKFMGVVISGGVGLATMVPGL